MKDFLRTIGIMALIFGGMLLYSIGFDAIAAIGPTYDLYAEDTDYLKLKKTDHINVEIDASLGCFVQETTTHKKNGAVTGTSKKYYYAIPVYSGEETYWIGLEVKASEKNKMEQIVDETYAYLMGEDEYYGYTYMEKEGHFRKLPEKKYKYMVEYFEELEWFESQEDLEKYLLPVYFDNFAFSTRSYTVLLIVGICLVLFGIIDIVLIIKSNMKDSKKRKEKEELMKYNYWEGGDIVINGIPYTRETLAPVEEFVRRNEFTFASKELQKITGIDLEEAKKVVDHWAQYCRS